jgi:hypothetical protein
MCRWILSIVMYNIEVKHVQVNGVHCLSQYCTVKRLCYIVQNNEQHSPAHVWLLYCTRQWTTCTCTYLTVLYCTRQWTTLTHCLVQYSTVKHVQVHVVHCLVQYSTVKHVEVNVFQFNLHLQMFDGAILNKTINNIHLPMFDCYIVQDNGKHAPAHIWPIALYNIAQSNMCRCMLYIVL